MVRYGKRFAKEMNRLANKYRSLPEDVEILIADLEHNPTQGASLGRKCYKVRLPIASKGKGKSGRARVITYVKLTDELIVLLSIYDKSEEDTIDNARLDALLREEGLVA